MRGEFGHGEFGHGEFLQAEFGRTGTSRAKYGRSGSKSGELGASAFGASAFGAGKFRPSKVAVSGPGDNCATSSLCQSPGCAVVRPATNLDRGLRSLDVIVAIIVLVLILPVLAVIALAIKCTSPGPVIFAHDRLGRGGQMFSCLKFRTMAINADDQLALLLASDPVSGAEWGRTHKLRNDPRITRIGAFLRKTSLDELPQIINVLRGDMSLVGPRPIVPAEIYRYGRHIGHYCSVRPGITGLWQISGRNQVSYRRRVALDVLYVQTRSFGLNLAILGRTLPCVIFANGT